MRIDFHYGPHPATEGERTNGQNSAGAASSVNLSQAGEDQAQLSGAHVQVTALAAQASQPPEIREERVQALRQTVDSGTYRLDPQRIAGAMVGHMIFGPGA
ncbi:MAG TPA: flagellar biosynthesis anti-sigma factor FlgM [Candidatus Binatia bacterium]|nr:flagellar biosynthesis anti-sigma factor FlgM [Candidatus Binatia bacterium]